MPPHPCPKQGTRLISLRLKLRALRRGSVKAEKRERDVEVEMMVDFQGILSLFFSKRLPFERSILDILKGAHPTKPKEWLSGVLLCCLPNLSGH